MQPLSIHPKGDIQLDLTQVRKDIRHGIRESSERCLVQTTKWLAELNYALRDHKVNFEESDAIDQIDCIAFEEKEAYTLAKSYFECQEYDRAAHFLESCTSLKCVFLHKYSQYMSSEKKRLDNSTDSGTESSESTQVLLDLLSYFKVSVIWFSMFLSSKIISEILTFSSYIQANRNNLDGYLLYLEGVVLKKLDLRTQAVTVLQASVAATPTLWAAWVELAGLANEYEALDSLQLPKHWMMHFFAAHAFVELKLSEQALVEYMSLNAAGFEKSTYVTAQMAIAHHDRRGKY